jgi:mitochondrial fission protein ELM1
VLTDDRPGNATQAIGLAEALGWPYEVKHLHCRRSSRLHNRLLGASCTGIDRAHSSPLGPPSPDLVIAAGRRTAPVAQWIRAHADGECKIVMLGRKGGDLADAFDLAVTPAYCRLLPHPNRIEIGAPLHRVTPTVLAEARAEWKERLADARVPRIAVLVGGTSGQYRIDAATAKCLGEDVTRMAAACGGSLLATTSRRLGPAAADAFCLATRGAAVVHRWIAHDQNNPYLGYLALADAFVITSDSESMLAEACSLGKPIYVYPLPVRFSFRLLKTIRDKVLRHARNAPPRAPGRTRRGLSAICAHLIEHGWVRPARDLDRMHAALIARGIVRNFGDAYDPEHAGPASHDLENVVGRVRLLMENPMKDASPLSSETPSNRLASPTSLV